MVERYIPTMPQGPPGAVTPAGDFSWDTPCPVPLALGSCLSGPLQSSRLTGHFSSILSETHYGKGPPDPGTPDFSSSSQTAPTWAAPALGP